MAMQVLINGVSNTYTPDYSIHNKNWKTKLGCYTWADIGGTQCFIKRFANGKPSAHDLLLNLKGKPVKGMPRIYDYGSQQENGKAVYYLFIENIQGNTLKEVIEKNGVFDVLKILSQVLAGLNFIHAHDFWFSDLNEENIFCTAKGDYCLIDVDSCWHHDILPNADPNKDGGMPSLAQGYAVIVLAFYQEIIGGNRKNFDFQTMRGKNLNYLCLLALVAKHYYYQENKAKETKAKPFHYKASNFKDLHRYLHKKNEKYSEGIFERAIEDKLKLPLVEEMGKMIVSNNTVVNNPSQNLPALPIIDSFTSNKAKAKKGESIVLSWQTRLADSVYLDGALVNGNSAAALAKKDPFVLTAKNAQGEAKHGLKVELEMPTILSFRADKDKVKKDEVITLTWSTQGADWVEVEGTRFPASKSSATIQIANSCKLLLKAGNDAGSKSRTLSITVVESENPIIHTFKADKSIVKKGEWVTFSWYAEGATWVEIDGKKITGNQGSHAIQLNYVGNISVTLYAKNSIGVTSKGTNITVKGTNGVNPPVVISFIGTLILSLFLGWQYWLYGTYNSSMSKALDLKSDCSNSTEVETLRNNAKSALSKYYFSFVLPPNIYSEEEIEKSLVLCTLRSMLKEADDKFAEIGRKEYKDNSGDRQGASELIKLYEESMKKYEEILERFSKEKYGEDFKKSEEAAGIVKRIETCKERIYYYTTQISSINADDFKTASFRSSQYESSGWQITKVRNMDGFTVINMTIRPPDVEGQRQQFNNIGNAHGCYYLKDTNNNKYKLRKIVGNIPFSPNSLARNTTYYIELYFEKLKPFTEKFDMIEGDSHPEGFRGIDFKDIIFKP